jgi:hypothetical protein
MSDIECTLVLTIEPASDPIAGTVRDPAGPAIPFVGYVELITHLERYRQANAAAPENHEIKPDDVP